MFASLSFACASLSGVKTVRDTVFNCSVILYQVPSLYISSTSGLGGSGSLSRNYPV